MMTTIVIFILIILLAYSVSLNIQKNNEVLVKERLLTSAKEQCNMEIKSLSKYIKNLRAKMAKKEDCNLLSNFSSSEIKRLKYLEENMQNFKYFRKNDLKLLQKLVSLLLKQD